MQDSVAPFKRTFRVGKLDVGHRSLANVTVNVEWTGERLSFTGWAQRPRANDIDQGGQMQDTIAELDAGDLLMSVADRDRLVELWERWHLNDMRAGCEHQRARGETYSTHPSAECPDCGYRLGSAWLHEDVPREVLSYLRTFGEAV